MVCSKCGSDTFLAIKYTAEIWEIDENGGAIHMIGLAPEADIWPDEESTYICKICGENVDFERSHKADVVKLFG